MKYIFKRMKRQVTIEDTYFQIIYSTKKTYPVDVKNF